MDVSEPCPLWAMPAGIFRVKLWLQYLGPFPLYLAKAFLSFKICFRIGKDIFHHNSTIVSSLNIGFLSLQLENTTYWRKNLKILFVTFSDKGKFKQMNICLNSRRMCWIYWVGTIPIISTMWCTSDFFFFLALWHLLLKDHLFKASSPNNKNTHKIFHCLSEGTNSKSRLD